MKCKYFILYLLVVCLLVSVISPGVLAAGNVDAPVSAPAKDLRVQPGGAADPENPGPGSAGGALDCGSVQSASSHANAALTASLQELKEASEIYAQNDVVAAFIVLEDAPLVEQGYDAIRAAFPPHRPTSCCKSRIPSSAPLRKTCWTAASWMCATSSPT